MTHTRNKIRTAILALSASIVLPTAPVFGQDATVTIAPPPPVTAAPPPATTAPPPVLRIAPVDPVITPPRAQAPAPAPAARQARTAPRAATPRVRAAAPARRAAAPAPAAAPTPAPAPVAETALPAPLPVETAPVAESVPVTVEETGGSILPFVLIGGALLLAALAFFALRRRRAGHEETHYEEPAYHEEPAIARATPVEPAPVIAAAPAFSAAAAAAPVEPIREVEEAHVGEADGADVEALAADSAPVSGRPWLEFLMRPIRAGTSQDDAIVQFELTVGNTGSVSARDVRISTWMVAAGQGTDMERSLIEAPAGAQVSEVDIAAGDGARVEGEVALSKSGLGGEPVLPVVVADARYTLPDGSEGRTHAAFAIGLPGEGEADELTPFPVDRSSGLIENVEARLHGEPERV